MEPSLPVAGLLYSPSQCPASAEISDGAPAILIGAEVEAQAAAVMQEAKKRAVDRFMVPE